MISLFKMRFQESVEVIRFFYARDPFLEIDFCLGEPSKEREAVQEVARPTLRGLSSCEPKALASLKKRVTLSPLVADPSPVRGVYPAHIKTTAGPRKVVALDLNPSLDQMSQILISRYTIKLWMQIRKLEEWEEKLANWNGEEIRWISSVSPETFFVFVLYCNAVDTAAKASENKDLPGSSECFRPTHIARQVSMRYPQKSRDFMMALTEYIERGAHAEALLNSAPPASFKKVLASAQSLKEASEAFSLAYELLGEGPYPT